MSGYLWPRGQLRNCSWFFAWRQYQWFLTDVKYSGALRGSRLNHHFFTVFPPGFPQLSSESRCLDDFAPWTRADNGRVFDRLDFVPHLRPDPMKRPASPTGESWPWIKLPTAFNRVPDLILGGSTALLRGQEAQLQTIVDSSECSSLSGSISPMNMGFPCTIRSVFEQGMRRILGRGKNHHTWGGTRFHSGGVAERAQK